MNPNRWSAIAPVSGVELGRPPRVALLMQIYQRARLVGQTHVREALTFLRPDRVEILGGSGMALLPNGNRTVASAERGVPGNADGILHALVRGTALDVYR